MDILNKINFGDFPTWLAGIGTVGALWFAVWQYRLNSNRADARRHIQQAEDITAWVVTNSGRDAWHAILNQSKNPIYEVILTLVPFQGSGDPEGKQTPIEFREFLNVVPPGLSYARTQGHRGMSFHPSVMITFTDGNGTNWTRGGDGALTEIHKKPMEYFDLPRPIGWTYPRSKLPHNSSTPL